MSPGTARQADAVASADSTELLCVCEDYVTGTRTTFGAKSGYISSAEREPRAWVDMEFQLDEEGAACHISIPATAKDVDVRQLCCRYYHAGCEPVAGESADTVVEGSDSSPRATLQAAQEAALLPYRHRLLFASSNSELSRDVPWRLRHSALQDGVTRALAAAACWAPGWSKAPLYRPKRFLLLGIRGALLAAFLQVFVPRCQITLVEEDAARAKLASSSYDWRPHRGFAQGAFYAEPYQLFLSREADGT
eukprot:6195528-Prymnesium_polylepis.1